MGAVGPAEETGRHEDGDAVHEAGGEKAGGELGPALDQQGDDVEGEQSCPTRSATSTRPLGALQASTVTPARLQRGHPLGGRGVRHRDHRAPGVARPDEPRA